MSHGDKHPPSENQWLRPLALGIVAGAGALILAPYVLPLMGIGTQETALQSINIMHSDTAGSGLAGAINSAMGAIPGIGKDLAQGGTFTAFASGAVGIGGLLLGNHLQKKEDGSQKFSMGKLVRNVGLVTSALIALPSILTGIGIGMVYLAASLGNNALASSVAGAVYGSLGTMGGAFTGPNLASGIFAAVPHIASCGAAILPTALTVGLGLSGGESQNRIVEGRMLPSPEPEQNRKYTDGSVIADMKTTGPLVAGQKADVRLTLRHKSTGAPLTVDELALNHTQKMHLFVVDQSLKDYHHIHPVPTETPGEYAFSFTPHTPNHYNAWTDLTLLRDDGNHRLRSELESALGRDVRAFVGTSSQAQKDGLNFDWKVSERLRKDTASIVEVTVTDAAGNPVKDLEPVLGAYAHLVGFSADGKSLIHTHPLGMEPQSPGMRGGPTLRFHVEPDFNGPAQFYLQVKRNGKDSFASFGQQVSPPLLNTEKIRHAHHASAAPAMG